jgi:hypothetical protein
MVANDDKMTDDKMTSIILSSLRISIGVLDRIGLRAAWRHLLAHAFPGCAQQRQQPAEAYRRISSM